jgi:hypothetical protein
MMWLECRLADCSKDIIAMEEVLNYIKESIDCMTMPTMPSEPSGRKLYEVCALLECVISAFALQQRVDIGAGAGHQFCQTRADQVTDMQWVVDFILHTMLRELRSVCTGV